MEQFEFLFSLIRRSGNDNRKLLWSSIASGVLQGILLYTIGASVSELSTDGVLSLRTFLLFVLSLVGLYKSLNISMNISSGVARGIVTDLEVRITDKLSRTSYAHFVTLEQGRIYDAITGSKDIVNEAAIMLPVFICSSTMLVCSLAFSAFISVAAVTSVLLVMGLGAVTFFYSDKQFIAALHIYRDSVQRFQSALKDVILGFTELKMNEKRRQAVFAELIAPLSQKALEGRTTADGFRVKNTVMYGLFVYFPAGALLFILPQTGLATLDQCITVVAITMFSTIPLIGLLSFMPLAARASFIVKGLEQFEASLEKMVDTANGAADAPADFLEISIPEARFHYPLQPGATIPFQLEVRGFRLKRGELVVLRGGNGSGKSTFMHLLAGLIPFNQGEVFLDGKSMQAEPARYRSLFSVVFPDFHLFGGIYGLPAPREKVLELLKLMDLDRKVEVDEQGRFSTIELSSGQRKRLALICAMLENRPVLLLDEVAADFDHHFREFFYRELLPNLKAEGRTLLVVSHDDRYFDCADRVLTLEYGSFIPTANANGAGRP